MSTVPTLWCTGLPSSGKAELGQALVELFAQRGQQAALIHTATMDNSTQSAAQGQTIDPAEMLDVLQAATHNAEGRIAVVVAESPLTAQRMHARSQTKRFIEIHVSTPKAHCIDRDTTDRWKKALTGELRGFTGVDRPYESPTTPEITVNFSSMSLTEAISHCAHALQGMAVLVAP